MNVIFNNDESEQTSIPVFATIILRAFYWLMLVTVVTGCTPPISPQSSTQYVQVPAEFPEINYPGVATAGRKILRVNPALTLVTINVRRGGILARLGHDHVIASHDVNGYVDVSAGRAELSIPLDKLTVDEPDLRSQSGLSTKISAEAIDATRQNMLFKVLESARYPYALIHASRESDNQSTLFVSLTLHGTTRSFEVPVVIDSLPDGIRISGQMEFNQSDFGIVPFSILGGAMQVQDRLDLRFQIVAGLR